MGKITRKNNLKSNEDALARVFAELRDIKRSLAEVRQLVGPFGLPMDDGSILTQSIHGHKYYIDARDEIMAPQMVLYRQWEADLSRFFLRALTRSDVFIDVGANFGYFTCLAASTIGNKSSGRVYSFEPNPRLFTLLKRNVGINWSSAPVQAMPVAVGSRSEVLKLYVPASRSANASLTPEKADAADVIEVSVVTLDETLPNDLQANFLKVDVEGHELSVLEGAKGLLARSKKIKIVMEWSVRQTVAAGFQPKAICSLLSEMGFLAYDIESTKSGEFLPIPWEKLLEIEYANVLLMRPM